MSEPVPTPPPAAENPPDHHALHRAQQAVTRAERSFERTPTTDTEQRLSEAVRGFTDTLARHFAFEEAQPFFQPSLDRPAAVVQQVDQLLAEHQRMRIEARKVEAELDRHPHGKAEIATVATALRDLFSHVERHEATERSLLHETFSDDLGEAD
jgi:hemerythrin-like domain-containing protein